MYELFTSQMYGLLEHIATASGQVEAEDQDDIHFYKALEIFPTEDELII